MKFFAATILIFVAATAQAQHTISGCQIFPTNAMFNQPITNAPVSTDPAVQMPAADANDPIHPGFGSILAGGFYFNVVPAGQAPVPVTGTNGYFSSAPIPSGAVVEGGAPNCSGTPAIKPAGDSHMIVLQQSATAGGACTLYEAGGACPTATGWNVGGEEPPFNLSSNQMPQQDNGADNAAGFPFLGCLVTPQDIAQGSINHMLCMTVPALMFQQYIWPATAFGGRGKCTGGYGATAANNNQSGDQNSMLAGVNPPTACPTTGGPAAGSVFRLPTSIALPACVTATGTNACPQAAMVFKALQTYGAIAIDNSGGPECFIEGIADNSFNDTDLHNLTALTCGNLQPVDVWTEAADLTAPIGDSTLRVPVTTYAVNVATSTGTPVIITATYNGTTLTASAVVNPAPAGPALQSLTISPSNLTAGQTSTLTITLNGPAPTGGATITLASNSTHFPVPSSLVIPAGATSGSVTVTVQ